MYRTGSGRATSPVSLPSNARSSGNIAGLIEPWHVLTKMDADVALLQEAGAPPSDTAERVKVDSAPWRTPGVDGNRAWRTSIVKLSERVCVEWIEARALEDAGSGELAVSRLGTLAAAQVTAPGVEPFVVVSMYSLWTRPHASADGSWIVSDASAHRLVSDLTAFIGRQAEHRILAAGDLNIPPRVRGARQRILGRTLRIGVRQDGGLSRVLKKAVLGSGRVPDEVYNGRGGR